MGSWVESLLQFPSREKFPGKLLAAEKIQGKFSALLKNLGLWNGLPEIGQDQDLGPMRERQRPKSCQSGLKGDMLFSDLRNLLTIRNTTSQGLNIFRFFHE